MRKSLILTMRLGLLFGGVLGILSALSACTPSSRPPPPAAAQPAAQTGSFAPGGTQTCLNCHGSDPKVQAILQSPMGRTGDKRTPLGQNGCESCHGPSADHAQGRAPEPAIVFEGPHASPVKVRNEVCLSCHEGGLRMNWEGSPMEQAGLACATCHTAHAAKDPILVKATQPQACFTCHARQRAESYMYSHHPIREGKVVCSDCHNPHGAMGDTKLLKEMTVNQTCYNCHADKRGPLLWEHQPVRDNCLNCHTPHGSNQPRLLIEPLAFLCSSCHSSTANSSGGAFGGGHGVPFRGPGNVFFNEAPMTPRGCLNCHSQVHGSNAPSGAFFLR